MAEKPVYTDEQIISTLDSGYHQSGTDLTYGFPTSTSGWFWGLETLGSSSLNSAQRAAATLAIGLWDDLIAPNFTLAANPTTANIKFMNTYSNVDYAAAYLPTGWSGGGSVWFDSRYDSVKGGSRNLMTPTIGDYGFTTYIKGIGATLGIRIPTISDGKIHTYDKYAQYAQDSQMYSVMSQFTSDATGADRFASDNWFHGPQTPLLHDVMAIQAIYGADPTTRLGDTTYGFHATSGIPVVFDFTQNTHPILCIYDAGGIDTLDFSGFSSSSLINLAPGSFSNCDMMTYNVSIAHTAWIENAVGGAGNDTLLGNTLANQLTGNAGADSISGGDGDDTLNGGAGGDTIDGGAGDNTAVFSGLRCAYAVSYDAATGLFTVTGADGVDTLSNVETFQFSDGSVLASSLTGDSTEPAPVATSGSDSLIGGSDADTISALAGDDTIDGGAGADRMVGGLGDDLYIVDNASDTTEESADEGVDTVLASLSWTLADNIENLMLTGTADISGTGNSLDNSLDGNLGANALSGGAGNDTISGDDGSDTLDGGAGADSLVGGSGDDLYIVDNASDVTVELSTQGVDTVLASINWTLAENVEKLTLAGTAGLSGTGNSLANTLTGNTGANILSGGDGNDTISGGAGNDTLDGGAGADRMAGGSGNDRYIVDNALDVTEELSNQGVDTVLASVNWTLADNVENLILTGTAGLSGTGNLLANAITGSAGADVLSGGAGNDSIDGGIGNDTILGGDGADRIFGNAGADRLTGNAGADTFVYTALWQSMRGTVDTITDFTRGVDRIDLRGIDAVAASSATDQAFAFIGAAAFDGHAGQLRFSAGLLQADVNGDRVADFIVNISNVTTLSAGDFLL
ncbi:M10 family metallopeptidase C-terminal domain-containing protein [Alsobacter sp. SYSU M60028]|uniref:M10 family metallopeptidase C-terminal domain-containing protein n=1 Tax=Alsobacter ponti TaxID=2962936 RepID=A0ABT1L841_9HYPH|nr:M10 family metallopeptidase C-terminal domain-containing protein [Alsobacter ponti]MCP8937226.1 M10 family metallopeptidase C-terminal domain-containing protein [Alsobacter ponti]